MTLRARVEGTGVTLEGRRGEEGRCASVELGILHAVGSASMDSTGGSPPGDEVVIKGVLRAFRPEEMAMIREVLRDFIVPVEEVG